jgi:hypothetical protein
MEPAYVNNRPRIRVEPGTGELVEEYSFDPRINEHKPVAGASYSVLLSLCCRHHSSAHPLHNYEHIRSLFF